MEEIYQGEKEDPAAFLQRLRDACRNRAQANPDNPENQMVLKHLFTTHCAPDIRDKLQKLPEGWGLPMAALLEVAQRVYHGQMIEKQKGRKAMVMAVQHMEKQPKVDERWHKPGPQ